MSCFALRLMKPTPQYESEATAPSYAKTQTMLGSATGLTHKPEGGGDWRKV